MNTTNLNFNTVIIIGSGWSGSSAFFEYLKSRDEVADPFKSEELRIVTDTFGLEYLYHAVCENFSPSTADFALKKFKETWLKVGKIQRFKNLFSKQDRDFIKCDEIESYINAITALSYSGTNSNLMRQTGYFKNIVYTILRKYHDRAQIHLNLHKLLLPVKSEIFSTVTSKWLNGLITTRMGSQSADIIAIEQAGNFWNPEFCIKLFGEHTKIVLVHRNPYDTFAEIKLDGHPYPNRVEDYVEWYNNVMRRIKSRDINSTGIINLYFEDFVNNFAFTKRKLDNFLGIDHNVLTSFDIVKSKINIGKYKTLLSKREIEYLQNKLEEFHFE